MLSRSPSIRECFSGRGCPLDIHRGICGKPSLIRRSCGGIPKRKARGRPRPVPAGRCPISGVLLRASPLHDQPSGGLMPAAGFYCRSDGHNCCIDVSTSIAWIFGYSTGRGALWKYFPDAGSGRSKRLDTVIKQTNIFRHVFSSRFRDQRRGMRFGILLALLTLITVPGAGNNRITRQGTRRIPGSVTGRILPMHPSIRPPTLHTGKALPGLLGAGTGRLCCRARRESCPTTRARTIRRRLCGREGHPVFPGDQLQFGCGRKRACSRPIFHAGGQSRG